MSLCAVCSTMQRRTSEDTWYWHCPEPSKLYFFCSQECKDLFYINPLAYEKNIQPEFVKSQICPRGVRSRLKYWRSTFASKQI